MKKLLLKLLVSKEERTAIRILTDIYYPVVEKETNSDTTEVKRVLQKLKVTFSEN